MCDFLQQLRVAVGVLVLTGFVTSSFTALAEEAPKECRALVLRSQPASPMSAPARRVLKRQADEWVGSGREQEAAWLYLENGDPESARSILLQLETKLRHAKVARFDKRPRSGSRTESFNAHFEDGSRAIFKLDRSWGNSAAAEEAAYLLDRLFGLNVVPVTVQREIQKLKGSLQHWVVNADEGAVGKNGTARVIRFLDFLINNPDRRNTRNFLTLKDFESRRVAIDHGLSFRSDVPGPGHRPFREETRETIQDILPPRSNYERMRSVSDHDVKRTLAAHVNPAALEMLLRNRRYLIEQVERLGESVWIDDM